MKHILQAVALAASVSAPIGHAAVITPVNLDLPGKGLNDPNIRAPEGGNPGRSVGEQRRIVYQYAADLWGAALNSDVETLVGASFQDLECSDTEAVLGSASASWINATKPSPPQLGMIYHGPLANALAGKRLFTSSTGTDINSRFNSNLGGSNPDGSPCLSGSGWYYGLDGKAPDGQIDFLNVVMHEIGHGLGFSGFVGYSNGRLGDRAGSTYYGYSDVYTANVIDNLQNKSFADPSMTNAMRALSIRTRVGPAWTGASTKSQTPLWLKPAVTLTITGAPSLSTQFFGTAAFGAQATADNVKGALAIANDGTGPDTADACEPLPPQSLSGKIAFINRGTCGFKVKAANAEAAGATAAIIGNVASSGDPNTAINMADDPTVEAHIPSLNVNLADANAIKAAISTGTTTASLGTTPGQMAGADKSGRPLLYAPATVANGSSFSHFETALTPNALMEPNINDDLDAARMLDLTLGVMADIGWKPNAGSAHIGNCDTGVKITKEPGLIAGANIQAQDRLCRTGAKGNRSQYLRCMNDTAAELKAIGMISTIEQANVRSCAAKVIAP